MWNSNYYPNYTLPFVSPWYGFRLLYCPGLSVVCVCFCKWTVLHVADALLTLTHRLNYLIAIWLQEEMHKSQIWFTKESVLNTIMLLLLWLPYLTKNSRKFPEVRRKCVEFTPTARASCVVSLATNCPCPSKCCCSSAAPLQHLPYLQL